MRVCSRRIHDERTLLLKSELFSRRWGVGVMMVPVLPFDLIRALAPPIKERDSFARHHFALEPQTVILADRDDVQQSGTAL